MWVEAARAGANGVRILTMGHLAARLAGGFIQPIDPQALHQTVRASLAANDLGELDSIKALPGMARAVVATLEKVWRGRGSNSRRHLIRGFRRWLPWSGTCCDGCRRR